METKQEYKILDQEAWASIMHLYVSFEVDGETYAAKGTYYNGSSVEDFEVYNYFTSGDVDNDIFELGVQLIEDLEVEKHLTC